MDIVLFVLVVVVGLALVFDFTNGFHDAANATATVVATRALKPKTAVILSAACNFLALFVVGTAVADTVGKTVKVGTLQAVAEGSVPMGLRVTLAALLGAILWNYLTWHVGMPSSSSHALIGGLVGAGLSAGGTDAVSWSSIEKTALAIVLSPLVAFTVAFAAMYLVGLLQKMTGWADDAKPFKWGQIISTAAVSFGHGANDAQKTMGVIAASLGAAGYITADAKGTFEVPFWVEIVSYTTIAIGTLWGGWKIIETMGLKITKLNANSGVAANIGATTAIFGATNLGIPISTTHAAASSVMGGGVAAGTGLNWRTVGEMLTAWLITIPATATVGFLTFKLTILPGPLAWIATGAAVVGLMSWALVLMWRNDEGADEVEAMLPSDEELHTAHTIPRPHL